MSGRFLVDPESKFAPLQAGLTAQLQAHERCHLADPLPALGTRAWPTGEPHDDGASHQGKRLDQIKKDDG
jgi:hypothetical protein